jgi:hypothetical protein
MKSPRFANTVPGLMAIGLIVTHTLEPAGFARTTPVIEQEESGASWENLRQ